MANKKKPIINLDAQRQNANWLKVPKGAYTPRPKPAKGKAHNG